MSRSACRLRACSHFASKGLPWANTKALTMRLAERGTSAMNGALVAPRSPPAEAPATRGVAVRPRRVSSRSRSLRDLVFARHRGRESAGLPPSGGAARSAGDLPGPLPTRLETRTKESSVRASHREHVLNPEAQ